jgi:hypothetical protein
MPNYLVACLMVLFIPFTLASIIREIGRFVTAKVMGVKVYEFSLGRSPFKKIKTLFWYKETEFTLTSIPLVAATRFSSEKDIYEMEFINNIAPVKRLAIIISGIVFNICFAVFVFTTVFMISQEMCLLDAMFLSVKNIWGLFTLIFVSFFSIGKTISITDLLDILGFSKYVPIELIVEKVLNMGILCLFLYSVGIVSIWLVVINILLPPASDGEYFIIWCIEWVRGKIFDLEIYKHAFTASLGIFFIFLGIFFIFCVSTIIKVVISFL